MSISEETFLILRAQHPALALKIRNLKLEETATPTFSLPYGITHDELKVIIACIAEAGRMEAEKDAANQEDQEKLKKLLSYWMASE